MSSRKPFAITLGALMAFAVLAPSAYPQTRPKPPKSVRLYVFDNGIIKDPDVSRFRFKKEEIAEPNFVVCSYLIVHPKGTLMFDAGSVPDANFKEGVTPTTLNRYVATKTLKSQLAAVGYAPKDITYFALSHYHGDHIANSNDFAGSTWLVQKPERDAMFAADSPVKEQLPLFNRLKDSKTKILDGKDFDVFGDGTVVVKGAYGHTPGHQVIYLKLAKTGPILLSGDLYHYREERFTDKTPTFEFNGPQSLESRANIEAFLKKSGAQLWIEHDLQLFRGLKKAPEYLD
jgi:glyoxylase-like metal-dependent hydrolase (beta-lactamase superfamily II)